jgi:metal-responsive CopG/Arc/MetJ family transcriptional regulator
MGNKKTAISIEKPLFEEIDALAEEMDVSRSYLFSLAAKEFIQRHKSQKLLEAINNAYKDSSDLDDEARRLHVEMQSKHRRLVKNQW